MIFAATLAGLMLATILAGGPLVARLAPVPSSPRAAATIAGWSLMAAVILASVTP